MSFLLFSSYCFLKEIEINFAHELKNKATAFYKETCFLIGLYTHYSFQRLVDCLLSISTRDEGDIGVCGIAVLDHFSCGISGFLVSNCGIAVFSGPAGCGFFSIIGGIKTYR